MRKSLEEAYLGGRQPDYILLLTQVEISETTGLSLRTVQRIENGETEPRGDSLKRLAMAFDVSPDEIIDWTVQDNKGFLISLNLSALGSLLFPLLGIIVPLIIWISKKDRIRNVNKLAKGILNFQITWTMFLFIGLIGFSLSSANRFVMTGDVSIITSLVVKNMLLIIVMYLYNLTMILINAVRINKDMEVCFTPKIRFIR